MVTKKGRKNTSFESVWNHEVRIVMDGQKNKSLILIGCLLFGILFAAGKSSKISDQFFWNSLFFVIPGLNSGTKNRHNSFSSANFLVVKIGTGSVNHADSGDMKLLVRFPGNTHFSKSGFSKWLCLNLMIKPIRPVFIKIWNSDGKMLSFHPIWKIQF